MKALLLLTTLLLCLAPPAPAQEMASAPLLILRADRESYFVGEPVDLTFTLRNTHRVKLRGRFELGFRLNNLKVNYRRGEASPLLFVSTVVKYTCAVDITIPPTELPPGGSVAHTERLLYAADPGGPLLSEPGEYEFRATLYYQSESGETVPLESNAARVTVRAEPESEREALAAWRDAELLDFAQGNEGYVPEEKFGAGMSKAFDFVRSYGASVYAQAAKKALLDYLAPRAARKQLTPEEEIILERLNAVP